MTTAITIALAGDVHFNITIVSYTSEWGTAWRWQRPLPASCYHGWCKDRSWLSVAADVTTGRPFGWVGKAQRHLFQVLPRWVFTYRTIGTHTHDGGRLKFGNVSRKCTAHGNKKITANIHNVRHVTADEKTSVINVNILISPQQLLCQVGSDTESAVV